MNKIKSKDILISIYYIYLTYLAIVLVMLYPALNINLSYSLVVSMVAGLGISLYKGKYRRLLAGLLLVGAIISAYFLQGGNLLYFGLFVLYYLVLTVICYVNKETVSINAPRTFVIGLVLMVLATSVHFVTGVHDDIIITYSGVLSFLLIGVFASMTFNVNLFYHLPFIQNSGEQDAEYIENVLAIAAVVVLALQKYLLTGASVIIMEVAVILLHVVFWAIRGAVVAVSYLIGVLGPDVPVKTGTEDSGTSETIIEFIDGVQDAVTNYQQSHMNQFMQYFFIAFAVVMLLIIFYFIFTKLKSNYTLVNNALKAETVKSYIPPEERGNNKKKKYVALTPIRRKYRKNVKKLIKKDYQFPPHITANEYLSTLKEKDKVELDMDQLTAQYLEERYNHQ